MYTERKEGNMNGTAEGTREVDRRVVDSVWWTLRLSFGLVPLLAGLDKFFNLLVHWPKYIAPVAAGMLPMTPQHFMYIVGIIEIVAGLGVLLSPWTKAFATIVGIWLIAIALNLLLGNFYDIAVRDLAMGVTALSLARLTSVVHVPSTVRHAARHATVG
jgi:uncharacterized membrane protein YphA (DoxX/SURF4 family)